MKKIIAIAVILAVAVTGAYFLTGCGSENGSEKSNPYDSLAGDYQDSVSQRATASVTVNDDNESINIAVYWSNSVSETTEWTMTGTLDGDKLSYDDCKCKLVTTDEDGNTDEETLSSGGSGYFEIGDKGELLWTGADDEQCQTCVFELIAE